MEKAVHQGRFREDLFYRLDVFPITMPQVRKRTGDVPLIVDYFLKSFNGIYHKHIPGISPECINRLESYDWPGNVREIKNVLHRAVVMCSGEVLLPEHLPKRFFSEHHHTPAVSIPVGSTIHQAEKALITQTLNWTNNNRQRTATLLGITRTTLYNKIGKYKL